MKKEQYITPDSRILELAVSRYFLFGSTGLDSSTEPLDILEDDASSFPIFSLRLHRVGLLHGTARYPGGRRLQLVELTGLCPSAGPSLC